ncbi:MAG: sugar phosphate isomerase/epimerase family protein [Thermoflexus sp.]
MSAFGFKGPDVARADALEPWLPDLRAAGFSWIELRAPDCPDPAWEARLRGWRERDGWSFAVHARFFGVNLSSPNPRVRQAAIEVAQEDLQFAARIGARRVNLHAGDVNWYDVPPPDHPAHEWMTQELNKLRVQHLGAAASSIKEISEVARELRIEIAVENLYKPWELLRTPDEVREFFEQLELSIGFTLDIGHALLAGWPPEAFLQALNDRVRHVHLHWNDGAFDIHSFPDLSEPAIQGVMRAIAQWSPETVLVIEITPGSWNGAIGQFLEWPVQAKKLLGGQ